MKGRPTHPVVLFVLLIPALVAVPARGQGLADQMHRVTMRFVEETGDSVLGVGSWIDKRRFVAGVSDFDMRLVVRGTDERLLRAQWEASRQTMVRLIREEFGHQAPDILRRTNLYPPQQLMRGVVNTADALEAFQRFNTVPNLAHSGPVDSRTVARFSEGLYGTGAQTWIQTYERSAGRLFYMNHGRATTGLAELVHLGEGAPAFTVAGTSHVCGEFVDKALHALNEGSGREPAKIWRQNGSTPIMKIHPKRPRRLPLNSRLPPSNPVRGCRTR